MVTAVGALRASGLRETDGVAAFFRSDYSLTRLNAIGVGAGRGWV